MAISTLRHLLLLCLLVWPASFHRPGSAAAEPQVEIGRSIETLTAQAESGDAEAQFWLGLYLQHSKPLLDGGQVDYRSVIDLYESAAAQGHVGASFALARLYDQGLGVAKDINQAIELYGVAAKAGHAEAMGWLAAAYVEVGDFTFAYHWSSRAADLGDAGGMNTLGSLYHTGLGAEKDYARAMELYRRAAEGGECLALMNIGGLYYNGDGVPQDGREAEQWFGKARSCETDSSAFVTEYTQKYLDNIRSGNLPELDRQIGGSELAAGLAVIAVLAGAVAASETTGVPAGHDTAAQAAPACGQEYWIEPSKMPCGTLWRAQGQWPEEYWCYTDYNMQLGGTRGVTYCTNGASVWERSSLTDPCSGAEGWCDNYGVGPRAGFFQ